MIKRAVLQLVSSRRRFACILTFAVLVLFASTVRIRFYRHLEGLYVLRGESGLIELKDDLVLGDEKRLLLALPAEPVFRFLRGNVSYATGATRLEHEWFRFDGSGFVRGYSADGSIFLTCLSRFLDSAGKETKGLFVGGGLPFDLEADRRVTLNETGMAFYDGSQWHHIWCNANESIAPWRHPADAIPPSSWRFLGSSTKKSTSEELVLTSSHEVPMDGVPFRIDRFASFRAGARHMTLAIRITNTGTQPAGYFYIYGDEPWLGNYGSSVGNVGWVHDRIVKHEGTIDPQRYGWAGYFDYGNDAAGEAHVYSGIANFIDWQAGVRPDTVYFSNRIGAFADERDQVPLSDASNRVLFLQWGPRLLNPGQSETIVLSVGMADINPVSGFPVKPDAMATLLALQPLLGQGE